MKLYISLPINTIGFNIETQRNHAKMWQRYFEGKGHTVSNPFEIYDRLCQFHERNLLNPPTRREIMTEDLTELMTNNRIFFCDGWSCSDGCIEEAETSWQIGIKPMFEKYMKV